MSARSLNRVQLIGNLTRDPELRYTGQGTPVCSFGLATNRDWTDQTGQKQEETEFHRIVAWQKLAELCSQLLFKGRKVYVEGRLQTRKWTGADNQERQTTEVVIDNMIILDSKFKEGEAGPGGPAGATAADPAQAQAAPVVAANDSQNGQATDAPTAQTAVAKPAQTGKKAQKKQDDATGATNEEVQADDIPF